MQVLACDGLNIFSYVTEWALFAVYYKTVFNWSSALTGEAQIIMLWLERVYAIIPRELLGCVARC